MSRALISPLMLMLMVCSAAVAKDPPARERGVLAEMQSVSCGYMQKSGTTVAGVFITGAQHTKSRELLCQEYVLKTDRVTYRIRPKEENHPVLLRVGDEAEFRLKKDELLLRVPEGDNKEREYFVVSMTASPELTTAINKVQHPPKPHGKKLDANADSSDPAPEPTQKQASARPAAAVADPPAARNPAPTEAILKIDSMPAGAEVFIDSAPAGHTPAMLKVIPGQHSVQVVLAGFKDWSDMVNAAAGAQQQVTANLARQ